MKNKTVTLMFLLSLSSLPAFAELKAEREPHRFASNSFVNREKQEESLRVTSENTQPEKIEIKRIFRHVGRSGM